MRQAGIIAAGALYALEHHVARLADDHANAQRLAAALRELPGLTLTPDTVDTNIIVFRLDPQLGTSTEFAARLKEHGVLMLPFGPNLVRAVTHLDVAAPDIDRAVQALRRMFAE